MWRGWESESTHCAVIVDRVPHLDIMVFCRRWATSITVPVIALGFRYPGRGNLLLRGLMTLDTHPTMDLDVERRLGGVGPFVINLEASAAPMGVPAKSPAGSEQARLYRI